MQRYIAITIVVLLFSASFIVILTFNGDKTQARVFPEGLYVGVTADGNLTTTIRLIDKVNKFSNMLVILNPEIVKNQTKLTKVCDHAQKSGMSFYIHMSHPSYWNFDYNPFEWYYEAKEKYKENFLGIYLYDEPGGNQLDLGPFREFDFEMMPYDYRDAANTFTYYLYVQMRDFIKFDKIVTSDYGLFWFDYEAGYDVIFCDIKMPQMDGRQMIQIIAPKHHVHRIAAFYGECKLIVLGRQDEWRLKIRVLNLRLRSRSFRLLDNDRK